MQSLAPVTENAQEADLRPEVLGSAATSNSVAALASNKSWNRTLLFRHISATNLWGI